MTMRRTTEAEARRTTEAEHRMALEALGARWPKPGIESLLWSVDWAWVWRTVALWSVVVIVVGCYFLS